MATKTISVDLEAYNVLCSARAEAKESFSRVIKRGHWETNGKTCGDLLRALENGPCATEEEIAFLERAQLEDVPARDKWAE